MLSMNRCRRHLLTVLVIGLMLPRRATKTAKGDKNRGKVS
jgi:hypothetical protein